MPNLHLCRKELVGFLLIALIISGITAFLLIFEIGRYGDDTPDYSINVSYNTTNNSLEVEVISYVNKTIIFNEIVAKDSNGNTLFNSNLPSIKLAPLGNVTFSASMGKTALESGTGYHIELLANNRQKYTYFLMLFEWVHVTKVTSLPKTLLVEIQSLSNKTIIIDSATVSQWQEVQYSPDYKSLADIDITEGVVSPSELLPNQNITLTISLKNDLNDGNYCLKLHNSSPEWVRGGERINFVASR